MSESHADRDHAILSPSFMKIALACSGAVGLKEKLPKAPSNEAADRGTMMHEVCAEYLQNFLEGIKDPIKFNKDLDVKLEKKLENESDFLYCVDYVDAIWKHAFEESITGKYYEIEAKLTYSEKFSLWGTADFFLVATDERARRYGHIIDLKTGHIIIKAKDNPQLAAYAVALRKEMRDLGKDLDYVKVGIYQTSIADDDKYDEVKFSGKQLDKWEQKFLKLAEIVFNGKGKFKAGEHCQYCPGRAHCSVNAKYLSVKDSLDLTDPGEVVFPDVARIPKESLIKLVLHEKAISKFLKAAKARIFEMINAQEDTPGVKAVNGKAKRKIDESKKDLIVEECAKFKISPFTEKLKGIGELEKALTPHMGKAADAKALVGTFTTKGKDPILLVPEDDERMAIVPDLSLLDDVDEDE